MLQIYENIIVTIGYNGFFTVCRHFRYGVCLPSQSTKVYSMQSCKTYKLYYVLYTAYFSIVFYSSAWPENIAKPLFAN